MRLADHCEVFVVDGVLTLDLRHAPRSAATFTAESMTIPIAAQSCCPGISTRRSTLPPPRCSAAPTAFASRCHDVAVMVLLVFADVLGRISLPAGVVGHEGSTLLVTVSGLRLLLQLRS